MVACWNTWMIDKGKLHIEVPDMGRIARIFANPFSGTKARAVAERHLFGSHEAPWAAHYEGYDARLLSSLLKVFGFKVVKIKRTCWRGTHNIHVFAEKISSLESMGYATKIAEKFLSTFLVDNTLGEIELMRVWMDMFEKQLHVGWASN
jgi:hypothetical protein